MTTADIAKTNAYHCFTCTAKQSPCIIHSSAPLPTQAELERNPSNTTISTSVLRCANCFSTTTPLWRRDPQGRTICNACGLYYKLNKVHRPACLKQDVIRRRRRTSKHMKSLTIIPVHLNQQENHRQLYTAESNLHYNNHQYTQRHQQGGPYPNYYQHYHHNRMSQQYQANHFVQQQQYRNNQNPSELYYNRYEHTASRYNHQVSSNMIIPSRSRCNSLPTPFLRTSTQNSFSTPQLSNSSSSSTFTSPPLENYSTFLTPPSSTVNNNELAARCKLPSISELLPELIRKNL